MLSKCWGMQTSACHGGCPLWNRIYGFALPMRLETSVARFTRWLRMCARYLSVLGLGNSWNFLLNVDCYDLFQQHCLPDCEETHYTAILSAAPFRRCDYKNLGMTPLCQFGDPEYLGSSVGSFSPPMWGGSVFDQYRKEPPY